MPRRVTIPGKPPMRVFTISDWGSSWDKEFDSLKSTPLEPLLSYCDRKAMEAALKGHLQPIREAIRIQPQGALLRLPQKGCRDCQGCLHFNASKCRVDASVKAVPWCFRLDLLGYDDNVSRAASEVAGLWRESVYVLVVREED